MAPDLSFLNRLAPADPVPDAELLRRFAAGDGPAFELLVRRHAGLVWRVCRSALPADAHAAEDAFQASFLALARHAGRVRGASAAGWLARVARHAALRRRRSARPFAPLPEVPADPPPDPVEAAETAAAVLAEVTRLPARLREPVLLCLLEGCSHAEAAARLSLPVGTVASRLSRARAALRGRLARRGLAPAALAVAPAPAGVVRAGVAVGLAPSSASPAVSTLAAGAVSAMSAMFRLKLVAGLVLAAGAVAFSVSASQAPKPVPAADDLAKLQGKWKVVSIQVQGKKTTAADVAGMTWTFSQDVITASDGPGGKAGRMPYKLDAGKSPRWIDLTMPINKGGEATAVGIYKLAGDRLTVCLRGPDEATRHGRPTEFAVDGGADVIELVRADADPPPAAPVPPPKPVATPADELAKLQGKWRVKRLSMADQSRASTEQVWYTITGDAVTREPFGRQGKLTLTLDPSHTPKRIEMAVPAGGDPRGLETEPFVGIYKLDGDTMSWCLRSKSDADKFGRPTAFVVGGGAMVLELVRPDGPAVVADLQGDWEPPPVMKDGKPDPTHLVAGIRAKVREDVLWLDRLIGDKWTVQKFSLSPRPTPPGGFTLDPLATSTDGRDKLPSGWATVDGNSLAIRFPASAGGSYAEFWLARKQPPGAALVGEWQRPVRGEAADDTMMVWTFRDTGVCRIDYLDTASGRVNVGAFAGGPGVGRWRVEGGELVLETEAWVGDKRWPHRAVERLPIESVTADALVVRRLADPQTTRWVTERYTRFPGWDKLKP